MATKEEYEKAVKNIKDAFYAKDVNLALATKNFKTNLDFLSGLVTEHFKEKQETNLEHYYDDLLKVGVRFAFTNGKVKHCYGVNCCDECAFGGGSCEKKKIKWLASPHEKLKFKLTQFEKDLLQCYSSGHKFEVFNSLIGMKEKGYFKDIDFDLTIDEILNNCEVIK